MIFFVSLSALADVPLPVYPECGEEDRFDLCPEDIEGEWHLYSFVPESSRATVRTAELEYGSGNRADRAFQVSTGRFDVVIGIMDSGVYWSHSDLVNKYYLHQGELPLPQRADGSTALNYDSNGDGVFNVQDYAEDPRVDITSGQDRADDILDPSDLIYTFSDGVDDDGNGYVDDISGWDFFERDNDSYHTYEDGFGDHGTTVARDVAAEGNNGGDIGTCPNCSILPLRVGETFLTDGPRCAEAIAYGTEMNATSITMAVGALSNSDATTAAAKYAWEMGTLLVGAAGDENSYHHNFPAVLDDVLFVHSITHNTANSNGAYSYMNTWNCNNFGSRISMVAASPACATGAVAVIAGAAGLIKSAGLDLGVDLSAGEMYQLLTNNATDVWLSDEERAISKAYPSEQGWDPFYGYGRLNIEDSVRAVVEGRIPPVVSIRGIEWFETIDPTRRSSVAIEAVISAERSSGYDWILEYGLGHSPQTWTEIDSGSETMSFDGVLVNLDVQQFPSVSIPDPTYEETIEERLQRVYGPAVTLRLQVTDNEGNRGQMRKTFFVHPDPDLKEGFPVRLNGSGESSPIMYDLTGDGIFEIVVADASGWVHALDGSAQPISGFPVRTLERQDHAEAEIYEDIPRIYEAITATPAAGDLDGDGDVEVVAAGLFGHIYAWHHDGSVVAGFPYEMLRRSPEEINNEQTYDNGFFGAPTLYDLDDNGDLEIIVTGMDSRLYIITSSGENWNDYPIDICFPEMCGEYGRRIITSPAVGDVDGDGDIEIGIGSNEAVNNERDSVSYLLDANTGELLPGWPVAVQGLVGEAVLLPVIGEGHPASLSFADLDLDGDYEVANAVMLGLNPPVHHDGTDALEMSFYGSDFSEESNADVPSLLQMVAIPVFGDLNADGHPEYITSGVSSVYVASLAARTAIEYQQGVGVWSGKDGAMLDGWPRQIEDVQFLTAAAVADITGDDWPEVIAVSGGYLAHAWDKDGTSAPGWPKLTGNWILGSPAVGDIDGDGYLEVAVTTREGWLFVWSTQGHADQKIEWSGIHHDAQNTGNYHHPLPAQDGPPEVDEGCCSNGDKEQAWILFPLLAIWGWRRRVAK